MSSLQFIAVLVAVVCTSEAAEIGNAYCGQRYQEALEEALTIKKECNDAAFYDCCQVMCSLDRFVCDTWFENCENHTLQD